MAKEKKPKAKEEATKVVEAKKEEVPQKTAPRNFIK